MKVRRVGAIGWVKEGRADGKGRFFVAAGGGWEEDGVLSFGCTFDTREIFSGVEEERDDELDDELEEAEELGGDGEATEDVGNGDFCASPMSS